MKPCLYAQYLSTCNSSEIMITKTITNARISNNSFVFLSTKTTREALDIFCGNVTKHSGKRKTGREKIPNSLGCVIY